MKIGIYTFHADHNVGAMLQAYGLWSILDNWGIDVEFVNLYPKELEYRNFHKGSWSTLKGIAKKVYIGLHPQIEQKVKSFENFHNRLPLSKRYFSPDEYILHPNLYDIHLVGSDQVWNCQKGYNKSRFFFLDYLPAKSTKISYGSSFGTIKDIQGEDEIRVALSSFNALSVREDVAAKYVQKLTGKECKHVLDPTLLLSSEEWDDLLDPGYKLPFKKYIFFYGMNSDIETWNLLNDLKKRTHAPIVGFPGPLRPNYPFDKYVLNAGPLEFVNLIKNAHIVVTSSFHGLAFALNYEKNFIVIKYGDRMERMESLIRLFNLRQHLICSVEELDATGISNISVSINDKLLLEREKSLSWLYNFFNND